MSSLASSDRFVVLPLIFCPDRGNNFDSISISLQTSDTNLTVRSSKSLCLILTKPPLLQLMRYAECRIYFLMDKMLEDL